MPQRNGRPYQCCDLVPRQEEAHENAGHLHNLLARIDQEPVELSPGFQRKLGGIYQKWKPLRIIQRCGSLMTRGRMMIQLLWRLWLVTSTPPHPHHRYPEREHNVRHERPMALFQCSYTLCSKPFSTSVSQLAIKLEVASLVSLPQRYFIHLLKGMIEERKQ